VSLLRIIFYTAVLAAIFALLNVATAGLGYYALAFYDALHTLVGWIKAFEMLWPVALTLKIAGFLVGLWVACFFAKTVLSGARMVTAANTSDSA
jgi:hypothetical protein